MARTTTESNRRLQIRVDPEVKARLARAAALQQMDLSQFVTQTALREADAVIAQAESIKVSTEDFLLILELLENPPELNAKMKAAIAALSDTR